ncbi:UNKNOWN [Stylonychia lemnae]|uniref:Uncharacterized protein n=1 Tax=Stylonychia lemnae TaxID=5949 RepID=A0A078BBQ6_STYLE|nr:UNKNOWN [Stylonychia lemnae]|eukprot:CDW91013.1 UNKNOWN [Stylonychia lemnae]
MESKKIEPIMASLNTLNRETNNEGPRDIKTTNQVKHYTMNTDDLSIKSPLETISSTFKQDEATHNFIFRTSCKSLNRYEKFRRNQKVAMTNHSNDVQFENSLFKDRPRFLSQNASSIKNSTTVLNQTFSIAKTNGFKEFRITNDLKEIQKWLDNKEMYMEDLKKEIHSDGAKQQDQERYLVQYYSMFHSAFKEILKLIPEKNLEMTTVLKRIQNGFKDCFQQFQQKIRSIHQQSQEQVQKIRDDYAQLMQQFEEFQSKNDLNKYFTKNLDASTRATVIKDIQELFQNDWSVQLDKSLLEVYRFSESTRHLTDINHDYEQTIKERLNFYMHQNDKEQEQQNAPIPVTTFRQQLDSKLNSNYNFAVQTTAKKILSRLMAIYKKQSNETSCQTMTFDEIKQQFEVQISQLQKIVDEKEDEREKIIHEIERARQKLDELHKERKKMTQELHDLAQSLDNQKEQQKSLTSENMELRQQLKQSFKKLNKVEESDKVNTVKVKQLTEENIEFKKQVHKLTKRLKKIAKASPSIMIDSDQEGEGSQKVSKFNMNGQSSSNINKINSSINQSSRGNLDDSLDFRGRDSPMKSRRDGGSSNASPQGTELGRRITQYDVNQRQNSIQKDASSPSQSVQKFADGVTLDQRQRPVGVGGEDRSVNNSTLEQLTKKRGDEMDQVNLLNQKGGKNNQTQSTGQGSVNLPGINKSSPVKGSPNKKSSGQQRDRNNNSSYEDEDSGEEVGGVGVSIKKGGKGKAASQERSGQISKSKGADASSGPNRKSGGSETRKTVVPQGFINRTGTKRGSQGQALDNDNEDINNVKSNGNVFSGDNLHEIAEEESMQGTQYLTFNNAQSKMSKYGPNKVTGGSIYSSPRERGQQDQHVQTLIRGNMLEDFIVNEEELINNLPTGIQNQRTWNEACQTESFEYVDYMSGLFYNELRLQLQEEISQHQYDMVKILLEKSKYVIEKIRFKAQNNQIKFQPLFDEKAPDYQLSKQELTARKEIQLSKHFIMNANQVQQTEPDQIQKSISKKFGSNMYFKKHRWGKNIGGINDEMELVSEEVRREKFDIDRQALRVIHKFAVGGGSQQQQQ